VLVVGLELREVVEAGAVRADQLLPAQVTRPGGSVAVGVREQVPGRGTKQSLRLANVRAVAQQLLEDPLREVLGLQGIRQAVPEVRLQLPAAFREERGESRVDSLPPYTRDPRGSFLSSTAASTAGASAPEPAVPSWSLLLPI
jgi:hypothetical protein